MAADYTVRVFDSFYQLDLRINAEEYEVVRAYFAEYTGDNNVAKRFTEILFRISQITKIPIMDLLKTFRAGENPSISRTLAYFLNSVSNKTVLYGVDSLKSPNQFALRNIVTDNS